jgi:hypothetical protein
VFEIANVQITGNGEIGMLHLLAPGAAPSPRPIETATVSAPRPVQVTTSAARTSDDLGPFLAALKESGAQPEKTVVPRLAVTFVLPAFTSPDQFAEHAVNDRLTSTLDLSAWVAPTEQFDHCVFLALYKSGVVRPISAAVAEHDQRTFLTLTDPLCFLDPGSTAEDFEPGLLSGSFELVGLRLPKPYG